MPEAVDSPAGEVHLAAVGSCLAAVVADSPVAEVHLAAVAALPAGVFDFDYP